MPFHFQRFEIPDIILIEAENMADERGIFREVYKALEFAANGVPGVFVQDNYSRSARGVLRGMHYQKEPKAQAKLVMALRGEVFDAAVDIRKGSPSYGRWLAVVLSAEKGRMLDVPVGFAHGFCALSEEADVVYKVTEEYAPHLERGIRWNDPAIGIEWPIKNLLLSPRDAQLPPLNEADNDFLYEVRRQ